MGSLTSQLFSWLFFGSKVVGGIVLSLTFVLYLNQDKLLYIPNPPGFPKSPKENPPGFTSPAEWSTTGRPISRSAETDSIPYEEHFVETSDGKKIHVWLMYKDNSANLPTLMYFHGNAGNMGFRLKNAAEMFAKANMNILMMDYRGFGSSDGVPNEVGLNRDAEAVLQFAANHPKLTNSSIIAFGRSLGGAVSISLAHKFPDLVAGVIVENTFLSVGAMVDVLMPYVRHLKSLVLRIKWDSDVKIAELKQPILFISGDSDQLVPPRHMKRLFDLAGKSLGKVFYSVLGGTHNDTWDVAGAEYHRRIRAFVDDNKLVKNFGKSSPVDGSALDGVADTCNSEAAVSSDEDNLEDPDYLIVQRSKVSLPTMGTNFQVK